MNHREVTNRASAKHSTIPRTTLFLSWDKASAKHSTIPRTTLFLSWDKASASKQPRTTFFFKEEMSCSRWGKAIGFRFLNSTHRRLCIFVCVHQGGWVSNYIKRQRFIALNPAYHTT